MKSLDYISPLPNLKIDKENRLKNPISGFFSLVAIIFILSITVFFVNQLFSRANSTIIYSTIPDQSQSRDLSELPYMIGLFTYQAQPLANSDRFFHLKSNILNMIQVITEDGPKQNITRISINHEKCDINKHFGKYKKYFLNIPYLNHYYCRILDQKNLTISKPFSVNSTFFVHNFMKCSNNSIEGTICKDNYTIESSLSNTFIFYNFLEYAIDNKNIFEPGSLRLRSDVLPTSITIFSRYWYYIKNVVYLSDMGLVFENYQEKNYFKFSRVDQTVSLASQGTYYPGTFASIFISMEYEYGRYQRNFMKIQHLLASTGGIMKGVWILFELILYLYNLDLYYFNLSSSLFLISKDKNKENLNIRNKAINLR